VESFVCADKIAFSFELKILHLHLQLMNRKQLNWNNLLIYKFSKTTAKPFRSHAQNKSLKLIKTEQEWPQSSLDSSFHLFPTAAIFFISHWKLRRSSPLASMSLLTLAVFCFVSYLIIFIAFSSFCFGTRLMFQFVLELYFFLLFLSSPFCFFTLFDSIFSCFYLSTHRFSFLAHYSAVPFSNSNFYSSHQKVVLSSAVNVSMRLILSCFCFVVLSKFLQRVPLPQHFFPSLYEKCEL
jgi:hypothetical protein